MCVCVLILFSEGMFGFRPFWDENIVPASPGKSVQKKSIDFGGTCPCHAETCWKTSSMRPFAYKTPSPFFGCPSPFRNAPCKRRHILKTRKKGMTFQKGEGLKEVPISNRLIYLTLSSMTLTTILASSILR